MDHADAFQSRIVDAFQGTDPQFQIGIDRILYKHRNVYAFQCVGYFLYGKRVGRSARADPKDVDAGFQAFVYMFGRSHFGGDIHARLFFHFFQPGQSFHPDAFKASRLGAGLPDAGPEYLDTFVCQLLGGRHDLFFCLGAAWSGYD